MKKLLIGSTILIGLSTATSFALTSPMNLEAESDLPVKVQKHQEQLDNHEARITNVEADVADLQTNTNTAPSVQRVEVPVPVAPVPTPEPTPEPVPVTVVSYRQIPDGENTDCEYAYSDGTTYTWDWKTVEWNQGSKITRSSGYCDDRAIGKAKA